MERRARENATRFGYWLSVNRFGGLKTDLPPGRLGRRDQLFDTSENGGEFFVVFLFQVLDFAGEIGVAVHQPTKLHKRSHDRDVDLDGTLESIATPCSVKACGRYFTFWPRFKVTVCDREVFVRTDVVANCDLIFSSSVLVSRNMKSAGHRRELRLTVWSSCFHKFLIS